jgi:hypothetical protein
MGKGPDIVRVRWGLEGCREIFSSCYKVLLQNVAASLRQTGQITDAREKV